MLRLHTSEDRPGHISDLDNREWLCAITWRELKPGAFWECTLRSDNNAEIDTDQGSPIERALPFSVMGDEDFEETIQVLVDTLHPVQEEGTEDQTNEKLAQGMEGTNTEKGSDTTHPISLIGVSYV